MLFTFGANSWLLQQPSPGLRPPPWQARLGGRCGGTGGRAGGGARGPHGPGLSTHVRAREGMASPGNICDRRVDGAGGKPREPQGTPSSQKWMPGRGPPGQAGGHPRGHGPSQLTPASHVSWAAPHTQPARGTQEAGGQQPCQGRRAPREGFRGGQSPVWGLCGRRPVLPLSGPPRKAPWPWRGVSRMGPILCPFLYKVNVRCKHLRPWALCVTEGQTERQRRAGAWPKSHHQ